MAKLGSSAVVITLTACALAVVTTLALQAKSSATVTAAGSGPGATFSSSPKASTGTGKAHGGSGSTKAVAVPTDSGSGKRVVYSLGQKRVWLVDPGSDTRTFTVEPSTVSPSTGSYSVYSQHKGPYTGSDGVQVENGVLFHESGGVVFGFSAATSGDTPSPDPGKHTGGIRETLADGQAMYDFATDRTKVVVVP